MSDDATQEARRRMWGGVASGYAARQARSGDRWARVVADWLVQRSDPQPGQVVLDLAAGAGALAHRVARDVGPDCRVICTDFASEMVEAARRHGAEHRLDNVEYRILDAERMDLADDSVDIILCRAALMIMADPGAALAESRRVLRPGGVFAGSVFTTAVENPWVAVPIEVFIQLGHIERPDPSSPGMFALGDPDHLRKLATDAGFASVEIDGIDYVVAWADEDDVWRVISEVNARFTPIVAAMDPEERDATRHAVIDAFSPYRQPDGSFQAPARAWGALVR